MEKTTKTFCRVGGADFGHSKKSISVYFVGLHRRTDRPLHLNFTGYKRPSNRKIAMSKCTLSVRICSPTYVRLTHHPQPFQRKIHIFFINLFLPFPIEPNTLTMFPVHHKRVNQVLYMRRPGNDLEQVPSAKCKRIIPKKKKKKTKV